jgi:hypothetical protein
LASATRWTIQDAMVAVMVPSRLIPPDISNPAIHLPVVVTGNSSA